MSTSTFIALLGILAVIVLFAWLAVTRGEREPYPVALFGNSCPIGVLHSSGEAWILPHALASRIVTFLLPSPLRGYRTPSPSWSSMVGGVGFDSVSIRIESSKREAPRSDINKAMSPLRCGPHNPVTCWLDQSFGRSA